MQLLAKIASVSLLHRIVAAAVRFAHKSLVLRRDVPRAGEAADQVVLCEVIEDVAGDCGAAG